MMRVALKIAYDGRKYFGFARQPNLKTIEGEIIDILKKNNIVEDIKESYFRASSRTDKGVSSLGNVISFNSKKITKKDLIFLSKQSRDILFFGFKIVNDDFYPRHAKYRHYRYYLRIKREIEEIIDLCSYFTGEHNFTNFAKIENNKNTIRKINNIVVEKRNDFILIDFFAHNFLWHQIRKIINSIKKFDEYKIFKKEVIDALIFSDKIQDFGLAVAEPLFLKDVVYDFNFEYNPSLLKKVLTLEKMIISDIFY